MAEQFTGTVEVLNSDSNLPTVILEGGDDERGGNCTLGGNGQDGDLTLKDPSGRQRIFLNASQSFARFEDGLGIITIFLDGPRGAITAGPGKFTGTVEVLNNDSKLPTIILEGGDDERGGNCTLGGNGQDGDLTLKDPSGRQRIFLNASQSFARFEDGRGIITIFLDGPRGTITAGAANTPGTLAVRDAAGRTVFEFTASNSQLVLGGTSNPGDLFVRDGNNNNRIHLDGAQGDIKLFGADCAEEFALAEPVDPGTVLVIDGGLLVAASVPYDSRVAGVASGAGHLRPGLILGHDGASGSRTPVALAGRVYCKIDASFGPVRPGDLLTTSATRGHAMRATDRERAFGAVIGKALEALSTGRALVPVLVGMN